MNEMEKLQKRAEEITAKIASKRDSLGELTLAGKDITKQLEELGGLEKESVAVRAALDLARRQAAEQSESARAAAVEEARAEIARLNAECDQAVMDLLETMQGAKALVTTYTANLKRAESLKRNYKLTDRTRLYDTGAGFVSSVHQALISIAHIMSMFRAFAPNQYSDQFGLDFEPDKPER